MSKRIWLTGAGKGIGRAVALKLAHDGWTVAASARTGADLDSLAERSADLPGTVRAYPLDITDAERSAAVFARIERDIGPLDAVLLNAGTHEPMPAADFSVAIVRRLVEVNLMGTANGLAPALAAFRARGRGTVAVVSSVAGYRGLPTAAAYGATKAALINMCEALRPECIALGIDLKLINPGFVRTPLTDRNDFPMPFLVEPDAAAARIVGGLDRPGFEIAFPTPFVLMLKAMRMLPYGLFFTLTRRLARI